MPRKQTIIDQLRKAIKESEESQNAIAKATEINQANLNRFINGQETVGLENFSILCKHMRLELTPIKPKRSASR